MNLRCAFGFHDWRWGDYNYPRLGITRKLYACVRCGLIMPPHKRRRKAKKEGK